MIIAQVCLRLATIKDQSMCTVDQQMRPATQTAVATIGLHNQRISAQTVGNRLKEAHLFSLYRADDRQRVWRCVGERFADVHVVDRIAHGCGGVMVWAGVCYGQRTHMHVIDGILNAQRCRDEILSPIVVPFIHDHHLMLQHDNPQPHVARICTQFLEAVNIPVLAWPAYSPDMAPIEHVWDALDRCIRQRVPVPANIQQLHTDVEEEWTNIPQATINNLIISI